MPFRRWLQCPECESGDTGVLAYRVAIVLECYECGTVEEFELGKDVPVHELDTDGIETESSSSDGD